VTTGEQLLTETSAVGFRVAPMEASTRAEVDEANGLMVVRGVPATVLDTRDANGRIHPRESFERALRALKKEGAFANWRSRRVRMDEARSARVRPRREG
jgi:ribosomal protein S21